MSITTDRSDYLPSIFGAAAEPDDLFAHDVNGYRTKLYTDIVGDAAFDTLVLGSGKDADRQHLRVKTALKDKNRDPREILADLLPDAAWYVVECLGAPVQFIVLDEAVWIVTGQWNTRTQRVGKSDALAAIYAAVGAADQAAA